MDWSAYDQFAQSEEETPQRCRPIVIRGRLGSGQDVRRSSVSALQESSPGGSTNSLRSTD
ncbi:hypothetical protein M406DRAFT_322108 [Cryphonectria parasitica EP155]|uniref:Uncharacterized protein n=1 Tax=Cryphonectria parasitica (strain ATCC 38755 / EP155) TaxID=660469 RepID=A0A9P4Y3I0_CRYP1|nr:uncharacterized protein M406DRAFT_322108 [Cryphonectria parasitica EP155]KAF3765839.1 hypothetical protein M406DRAFT_322108 [Cryphonectria parasitica EP155]